MAALGSPIPFFFGVSYMLDQAYMMLIREVGQAQEATDDSIHLAGFRHWVTCIATFCGTQEQHPPHKKYLGLVTNIRKTHTLCTELYRAVQVTDLQPGHYMYRLVNNHKYI